MGEVVYLEEVRKQREEREQEEQLRNVEYTLVEIIDLSFIDSIRERQSSSGGCDYLFFHKRN